MDNFVFVSIFSPPGIGWWSDGVEQTTALPLALSLMVQKQVQMIVADGHSTVAIYLTVVGESSAEASPMVGGMSSGEPVFSYRQKMGGTPILWEFCESSCINGSIHGMVILAISHCRAL